MHANHTASSTQLQGQASSGWSGLVSTQGLPACFKPSMGPRLALHGMGQSIFQGKASNSYMARIVELEMSFGFLSDVPSAGNNHLRTGGDKGIPTDNLKQSIAMKCWRSVISAQCYECPN